MIQCLYHAHSRCDRAECPGKSDVAFCYARSDPGRYPRPEPTPPGLAAMAGNLAKAVVAHIADGMAHASPEVQAEREAICRACPNLDQQRDVCNLCGCLAMKLKRSWSSSACPDVPQRWEAVSS